MVEFGNNCDPDEEFDDDLLSILDFPMEFLEGDGLVEDWDITNSQSFGPIPSSVLMGPPMLPNKKIDTGPARLFPGPVAAIAGAPEQKHLPNHVDTSGSHIRRPSKIAEVQESGAFETQSPISVLESNGSCLGGKSLSIKSNSTIPVRSRSKRARPAGVNPWLLASPRFSTFQKTSNARRSRESRKKLFQQPVAMDFMKDTPKKFGSSLAVLDSAHLQNASSHRPPVIKKCTHCESTKTPQWREGPLGPKTLCNACGVRFRSGRLFPEYRPVASPTFVPSQHSNSHKKVVEMRNKAKQLATKIKVAPISPQPATKTAEPPVSPQLAAKTMEPPISQWADVKTEEPPVSPQPEFVPMSSYLFDYMY